MPVTPVVPAQATYVPMPKIRARSWLPFVGSLLFALLGLGTMVGLAVARGGDAPIPSPAGGTATTAPGPSQDPPR